MKKIILYSVLLLTTITSFANGIIRGTVIDSAIGDPIMSANIVVKGKNIGTTTDFDGNYSLNLPAGVYTLSISSLGYTTNKIENVEVKEGNVTLVDASLNPAEEQIDEIVITTNKSKRSASALLTMQKKSPKLLDGISIESIKKNGDSNVASAIKRVTGVSVEDGKYVYVRGLSDRYSKTILNGVTIPGLDPDKNTVQMDLFPTNLIDNLIVYKTFSPDLPGDFTGGLVDISTKDFPSKKTFNVGMSLGLNPAMNFNKDFILYEESSMDWLGFGNNDRKLPFNSNTVIPDESLNNPVLTDLTRSFSKELGVKKNADSFLNQSYNISYGNQYEKENATLGLNVAFNYANNYTFYDDVTQGIYFKDTDNTVNNLDRREVTNGSLGKHNVIWSGLLGGAIKLDKSKYSISLFHSQNGSGEAADYISQNFDETQATLYKDAIQYSQKSVTNLLLKGSHHYKDNKLKFSWKVSPTLSRILEPDVRSTRLTYDSTNDTFQLQLGDGAGINRYFRTLNETNVVTNGDLEYKLKFLNDDNSKLKFGVSNTFKFRDYEILDFNISKTSDFNNFTENPNTILEDQNIWTTDTESGVYVTGFQNKDNQFKATSNVMAAYIMNELKISEKLKSTYGVRVENAIIDYDGYNNNAVYKEQVHNETVLLPSLNLIYAATEKSNVRFSASQTVARPSFKEKSNATIVDPISQNIFIGNIDLKETNVTNLDLRWEKFLKKGQMISVSAFYKDFKNPIEIVPFQLSPNDIQPKNTDAATIIGGELEVRKNLTNEDAKINVAIGGNFTYLVSQVDTKKVIVDISGKTEYTLRQENARVGESIDQYRSMQGQSPYIINGLLNIYTDKFDANLSYNVQGEKLVIVGSGIVPDVNEDPFHSLNFKSSYKFGDENQYKVSFSARNILNDNFEQFYDSYGADKDIYRSYSLGSNYSFSFSYKIY